MLWRPGYQPIIQRDIPVVDGEGIWIGVPETSALAEAQVWIRLFREDGLSVRVRLFTADHRLDVLVPPSLLPHIEVGGDIDYWTFQAQLDRKDRSFAVIASGNLAKLIVTGPPTEDAWEEFSNLAKSLS